MMSFMIEQINGIALREPKKATDQTFGNENPRIPTMEEHMSKPMQPKPDTQITPRKSSSKYPPIGKEPCWQFIKGRCNQGDECTRTHIEHLPFHEHGGCCRFFCLSNCTRGSKCNFHHDEDCRLETWELLSKHQVNPNQVGLMETKEKAFRYKARRDANHRVPDQINSYTKPLISDDDDYKSDNSNLSKHSKKSFKNHSKRRGGKRQ